MRNPKSHADDLHLALQTLLHMHQDFLGQLVECQGVDVECRLFFGQVHGSLF